MRQIGEAVPPKRPATNRPVSRIEGERMTGDAEGAAVAELQAQVGGRNIQVNLTHPAATRHTPNSFAPSLSLGVVPGE